jgi:DHA1 family quinolone resistance protein-like MFS transporter
MGSVRNIERTYYSIVSLFWLTVALPLPLIVLLHQARGLNLAQNGLLFGAYSLVVVLLEVPSGALADAIGRKRVALLSYAFMLAGGVVFLFAFSFPLFVAAWLVSGIARALSSGSLDAWFVDSLQGAEPDIDIQPSLAKAGTFSLLALGAGTLLGGLIPRLFAALPPEGTAVLTPLSMTVVAAGLVNLLLITTTALLVHEPRPEGSSASWRAAFRQVPSMVGEAVQLSQRNTKIAFLLGASMSAGLALAAVESLWQPHFAGLLGGAEGQTFFFGAVMAGTFLIGAGGNIVSIPLGRLFKKRYARMAAVVIGAQGVALALLAIQPLLVPAVGLFWLVYLMMGLIDSPRGTLINNEIPAERRSSMLSVFSLAVYAGAFVGNTGLGFVAERGSIGLAWFLAGTVLIASLLLYLQVDGRTARHGKVYGDEPESKVLETG